MNVFTKTRLLLGALALLVALNVATWITFWYTTSQPKLFERGGRMHRNPEHFMAKELNLNPEQMEQMRVLREAYFQQVTPVRENLGQWYHTMMQELGGASPNRQRLDSMAAVIGDLHYQHQLLTIEHFISVREVCTPEQLEGLKRFYSRMSHMGPGHHSKAKRMHRKNGWKEQGQ